MPTRIKSLSQKEFLLPVLEGKCGLLLLDKEKKIGFLHEFSCCKGYTEKSILCIWVGATDRDILEIHLD